jgi:hypothetical protein
MVTLHFQRPHSLTRHEPQQYPLSSRRDTRGKASEVGHVPIVFPESCMNCLHTIDKLIIAPASSRSRSVVTLNFQIGFACYTKSALCVKLNHRRQLEGLTIHIQPSTNLSLI